MRAVVWNFLKLAVASRAQRVYVTPFPGPGERQAVASIDGANPRWRKDGRELFFLGLQDRMVYSVAVTPRGSRLDPGQPHPLFKLPALGLNWFYDVTGDGQPFVAVIEGEPDPTPLKVLVNPRQPGFPAFARGKRAEQQGASHERARTDRRM